MEVKHERQEFYVYISYSKEKFNNKFGSVQLF